MTLERSGPQQIWAVLRSTQSVGAHGSTLTLMTLVSSVEKVAHQSE
jgi:hypothetical protein